MPQKVANQDLKDFIVKQSSHLSALELQLKSFNIFDILNISHREIRHSNFIGWLLDPNESHGFGEYFLMAFINQLKRISNDDLIDLNISDLDDTEVFREVENDIDIFILNNRLSFSITIENKINHREDPEQLEKYYTHVTDKFSSIENHYFVFLTPYGIESNDPEMKDIYEPFDYSQLTKIFKQGVSEIKITNPQIQTIMEQYIENVEKNILGKGDAVKSAQKIYKKYKNVIEFIYKNKPDFSQISDLIRSYIQTNKDYEIISSNDKNYIRFLPKDKEFKNIFYCPEANSWKGGYLLGYEIIFSPNSIKIKLCLGRVQPENKELKEHLQNEKAKLLDEMKKLETLKSFVAKRTKATTDYVAVGFIPLITLQTFFDSDHENMFEAFKSKFEVTHEKVLKDFHEEAKNKLVPVTRII